MLAKNFYDFAPHCTSCPRLPTIHVEVFISLRGERNLRDTSCFCCPQGAHGNNGRFQPTGGCAVEIDCWHVRHAYSDLLFQYMFIIVYPRGGSVFVDANGFQGLMYGSMTWYAMIPLVCGCVGCSGWVWIHVMEVHDRNQTTCGERTCFFKVLWVQMLDFIHFCIIYLFVPMVLPPAGGWLCGMLGCRHLWWRLASALATHPHHSLHGADIDGEWEGWQVQSNCFDICQTYLFLILFGAFMSYIIVLCMCILDLWKQEVSRQEHM